jgi:hypothetical protein
MKKDMKLVKESLNEFKQGGDPYEIMGIGSNIPAELKQLGFTYYDEDDNTYLDQKPNHTYFWGPNEEYPGEGDFSYFIALPSQRKGKHNNPEISVDWFNLHDYNLAEIVELLNDYHFREEIIKAYENGTLDEAKKKFPVEPNTIEAYNV